MSAISLMLHLEGVDEFDALLGELSGLLSKLGQTSPEIVQAVFSLLDSGFQLGCVETDGGSAAVAGHFAILLKPSKTLLQLMAALRAGDFDLSIFKHENLSTVSCDASTVAEQGAGVESAPAEIRVRK